MIRGTVAVIASAVLSSSVLLTACSSPAPAGVSGHPSETVSGATKVELTNEARVVYQHYLDAVERVSARGPVEFPSLEPYLTADAYRAEIDSYRTLKEKGVRTTGATRLIKFEAQSVDPGAGHIVAYACVDLASVRVIDSSGKDVTPPSRPNRQTSLPSFGLHEGVLRLEENGTWSGQSIC